MQLGNWIYQTTTTTGTGDLTLSSVTGWATFASQFSVGADGIGDLFYYAIIDDTLGTPLEAGIGRLTASTTLTRVRILASIVAGAYAETNTPVTLGAGTKRVECVDLAMARPVTIPGIRLGSTSRLLPSGSFRTAPGNSKAISAGTLQVIPFELKTPTLVTGMGVFVTTGAVASTVRMGLYRLTANLEPGGLIDQTGDVASTAAGEAISAFAGGTRRLKPGWYYAAVKPFGGNPSIFCGAASSSNMDASFIGSPNVAQGANNFGTVASAGAAMDAVCPTVSWVATAADYPPVVFVATAVP